MTITLPLPPNLNREKKQHWAAKHREREQWYRRADTIAAHPDFPRPPATPMTAVRVSAILVMPNVMDDDNALRRASKWPLDWLKTRGYIRDDSRKYVR